MKRRNYKTALKQMNKEQLVKWIEKHIDIMLQVEDTGGSTPLLTKIVYAKELLKRLYT